MLIQICVIVHRIGCIGHLQIHHKVLDMFSRIIELLVPVQVDAEHVRNPPIGYVAVTWMLARFFIGERSVRLLCIRFYARLPMKAVEFL